MPSISGYSFLHNPHSMDDMIECVNAQYLGLFISTDHGDDTIKNFIAC